MLPGPELLSKLLGSLYDAADDPTCWDEFLQRLTESTGAQSAGLVMLDVGRSSFTMSRSWMVDPEATHLYQQHYGSIDIWAQRGLNKRTAFACTSQELCPLSELKNSEVYADYMARFKFEHAMFVVAENTGSRLASVSLYRDSTCPEFTSSELDLLRVIAPHVRRAFKLHRKFSELKTQSVGLTEAIDMLSIGLIFFGINGNILLMNRSASALVRERDGLLATPNGLRAERVTESNLLEQTIREACATLSGKCFSAGGTVMVSRRARPPLQLQVSPIRNSSILAAEQITAVAFISDSTQAFRPTTETLRALYALTPAEGRVAILLLDGHSPKEIAGMIGVAVHTVRSQIRSIFGKVGVNRQSDLIRLLAKHSSVMNRTGQN